jgi:CheY-like chemotaxis protein
VLVVDDDAVTCNLIARILKERDSEVVAVTSVDRALAAMNGFQPDVIVSDIAMPDRDGYELLRQIRSREGGSTRRVRAMALTALSSAEDQKRIFEAGYRLHLTKPVESCALTEAVAELALN